MAVSEVDALRSKLNEVFGFPEFRPGQEVVCRAVMAGADSLVVMPTGSGKSLCYQLPALMLSGTALVISPLIALMEDQVAHLNRLGLGADRIHSGRRREDSRAAAMAYRDGQIRFLFIAPERFSVPGFPQFLARRKPSLVAVDEAHCISQWGHDFRPDYRMLKHYLPLLRPAPVIALTATATPAVQHDIVQQLALDQAVNSIQGFRRHNIAIEIVEIAPSGRAGAALGILKNAANRPAIVYVPSRRESEELATELTASFPTEPYHAGLAANRRQQIQERFLYGSLDVIVATIAFGMGIDKPDVRTVIHTALPGSTEAYYQEIGRAGRDGLPSRAILMHSYADRRRHDFFFDRDYPEAAVLDVIFQLLRTDQEMAKDVVQKASKLDPEVFETALDKLWVHGGAKIDPEENVRRGDVDWRQAYEEQSERRSVQLELMLRYASSDQCRMSALVRYFGDRSDTRDWCGLCDFCAPDQCIAQQFRAASDAEIRLAEQVIQALKPGISKATGRLHTDLCDDNQVVRDEFEELLAALARAGLLTLKEAVFEKDGRQIRYRSAQLTREGTDIEPGEKLSLELRAKAEQRGKRRPAPSGLAKASRAKRQPSAEDDEFMQALRQWRLHEARSKGVPAFRVASDSLLRGILEDRPLTEDDLLAISGVGPAFVKRYASDVLALVKAREPQ